MLARSALPRPGHLRALPPLPGARPSSPGFLHDPTPDEVRRALEGNQRRWLLRLARYGGELVHREAGVVWHDGPEDEAAGEIQVPFPRFEAGRVGEQLDALVGRLRARTPPRSVRLWLFDPARPADLPVLLLARGFRPGFRPRWMRLDLWRLRDARWGPEGLRIEPATRDGLWDREPHPYHGDGATARPAIRAVEAAARALPGCVVPFVAWLGGRPVAAATLHLTAGPRGIAGIYDVGVLPDWRNRGIGKAITAEACKTAWALGCPIAGLNATPLGEPVYRRLGFEGGGEGQTWELSAAALAAPAPSPEVVAFAEAIGRGDVAALDGLAGRVPEGAVEARLACGLTPLALAARFRRAGAAEWLLARGAALELLAAWDLGWTERAVWLVAERPELATARDDAGATPLHEAARRNDVELASLLLAAGAAPEVRDATFDATPLNWADHLGAEAVARLLREVGSAGIAAPG